MNSVERVKKICKERDIPISKLERDLGFSNAYIGQLKKGTFPAERLVLIANYLDVSSEYLLTGKESPAPEAGDGTLSDLLSIAALLTDDDREQLIRIAKGFQASYGPQSGEPK